MGKFNVLLVDDEKLLLDSLEVILSISDMNIIGKTTDGYQTLELLKDDNIANKCDIALVDLNMKGMGGIELIKVMKEKYSHIKILVLTTFYDDDFITEAISSGADGYLLKGGGKDVIVGAINQIVSGITVLDKVVMNRLYDLMKNNLIKENKDTKEKNEINDNLDIPTDLTRREKEICMLMVDGLSNKQIANKLFISEGTVKNYISSIYDKTGIHDRVKLIVDLQKC